MTLFKPEVMDFVSIMAVCCGFALWRGRAPERIVAVAVLVAWAASGLLHTRDFTRPQYGMFWVDLVLLALLIALATRTGRRWLMIASAFHVLTVGDHFAMMLDMRIKSYAYQTVMVIWGYAVLLAMVLGTWFEAEPERRRLRAGPAGPNGSPASSE